MSKVGTIKISVREDGTLRNVYASVNSKVLFSVCWFPSGHLYATFRSDKMPMYSYEGVSAEIWNELVNAESIGKKFNELVKGKFTCKAV